MTWYDDAFNALTGPLSKERKAALETLITTWEALEPRPTPAEIRKYVLPVLGNYKDRGDGNWEPAKPGFLSLSDYVRVRSDAFDDGRFANVQARVTAIRGGVISIKVLNEEDSGAEKHSYQIKQLDKRVAR